MFRDLIIDKFENGADYAFNFNGVDCQVNHYKEDECNYETQLYFGDKYIRWDV